MTWLQREMTAESGYFYAAQDADNFATSTDAEPEEGEFYVWTYTLLENLLSEPELLAMQEGFYLEESGNFEGAIVLQRRAGGELSPMIDSALKKLLIYRYGDIDSHPVKPARNNEEAKSESWPGRIPPVTDTKMIVSWNSLMISGLARAAIVMRSQLYYELAAEAAQFITAHQWHQGVLHRLNYEGQVKVPAQSEDYAFLIKAYLDLHQASLSLGQGNEADFLEQAIATQQAFEDQLGSEAGGYFNTSQGGDAALEIRERSWQDNATPSANGIAIANLVRLSMLTDDLTYLDQAERGLKTFGTVMQENIQLCPTLFSAFDWYLNQTTFKSTQTGIEIILTSGYWPTLMAVMSSMMPAEAFGIVCQRSSCQAPAQNQDQCLVQIRNCMNQMLGDFKSTHS